MDLRKGNAIKVAQSPPCKQSGLRMLENFYLHTLLHTGLKPDLFCPWPLGRSAALSFAWQHGAAEAGMVGVWMPSARQRCAKAYIAQLFWHPAANRVLLCLSERVDRTLRSISYLKTLSCTPGLFPFFPPFPLIPYGRALLLSCGFLLRSAAALAREELGAWGESAWFIVQNSSWT